MEMKLIREAWSRRAGERIRRIEMGGNVEEEDKEEFEWNKGRKRLGVWSGESAMGSLQMR